MTTGLYHDSSFFDHDTGPGHPEQPLRDQAVREALSHPDFAALPRFECLPLDWHAIGRAHSPDYLAYLKAAGSKAQDTGGLVQLDGDTILSPPSLDIARRGAGAICSAVDAVVTGELKNAFVASRPPGHHAERDRAMGFCLFCNPAIAAFHAQDKWGESHGIRRVAVIDFDVHHGNGTQDIFWSEENCFYGSTHQMPLYPGSGAATERGQFGTICNAPLPGGADGHVFREAIEDRILPGLNAFAPDLLIVSAGFDAHRDDPLAGCNLLEEDFSWVTRRLVEEAERLCEGRLISVLEGGYDLAALRGSVEAHLRALSEHGV
ncbi:histone deacetylase family protein [Kiloniella sp. b19]|uniref:histone deacetylase family protein n=1 Tax=Kiloniella sp. GXU_MW_B19 TaxID=3141326 RepID=UPI0031D9C085